MTAGEIYDCMVELHYPIPTPNYCLTLWVSQFNSTPPPPGGTGSWTIGQVCDWLAANYGGKSPCA